MSKSPRLPRYQRIANEIRQDIKSERLKPGDRLPGSRQMATNLGVSRTVVLLATDQLVAEGYLVPKKRSGVFVNTELPFDSGAMKLGEPVPEVSLSHRPSTILETRISQAGDRARSTAYNPSKSEIDFEYGRNLPDSITTAELKRLLNANWNSSVFAYGDATGEADLKYEIMRHVAEHRGLRVLEEQIIVTSGSQQALDLCARVLLSEGDQVAIEDPCYQGARETFAAAGVELLSMPVASGGAEVDTLPTSLRRLKLAYLTPSHQFPTGVTIPLTRRLELIAWASRNDCYLIEDDYDSEFRYDCRPIEPMASIDAHQRVIYVGTFAKTLFPGIRVGFVIVPRHLVKPFAAAKWLIDRGNPIIIQKTLADFIGSGGYSRHLRRMNRTYARKRSELERRLKEAFGSAVVISGAQAGTHLFAEFPQLHRTLTARIVRECEDRGVRVYPAHGYYQSPPTNLRLIFGYTTLTIDEIALGIGVFASACAFLDLPYDVSSERPSR